MHQMLTFNFSARINAFIKNHNDFFQISSLSSFTIRQISFLSFALSQRSVEIKQRLN